MSIKFPIFKQFFGVNNVKESFELDDDELSVGKDLYIDNGKRLVCRDGFRNILSGNFKNIYSDNNGRYGININNGNLISFYQNMMGYVELGKVGITPMSFVEINDITACTNYSFIGYIEKNTLYTFSVPDDIFKFPIPAGQLIEYFMGSIYIARDNVLWESDVIQYRYGSIDKRGNGRQTPTRITMLKAVDDGLWVSDMNKIYWLPGKELKEFPRLSTVEYPAIYGMFKEIDGNKLADPVDGKVYIIGTKRGFAIIGNKGYFKNITEAYYQMPNGNQGSILVIDNKKINLAVGVITV
jgi:hypothetical protein